MKCVFQRHAIDALAPHQTQAIIASLWNQNAIHTVLGSKRTGDHSFSKSINEAKGIRLIVVLLQIYKCNGGIFHQVISGSL